MKYYKLYMLIFVISLILSSCAATPASSISMLPKLNKANIIYTNKIIQILPVSGGEETNPMLVSKIGDKEYQEALINTLKDSGLFKQVIENNNNPDYILDTTIISHEVKSGKTVMEAKSILFVRYILSDAKSKKILWSENIFSQYGAKWEEAFYAFERARKAHEGAARENLRKLISKVADVLESTE